MKTKNQDIHKRVPKQGKTKDFRMQLLLTEKGQIRLGLQELLRFEKVEQSCCRRLR
jgi:hypothetical protein